MAAAFGTVGERLGSPTRLLHFSHLSLPACSQGSAARRACEAEARLKDFGEAERQAAAASAAAVAAVGVLPSAAAAFTSVGGPPAFLDPEVRWVGME